MKGYVETQTVRELISSYYDAVYNADITALRGIFHEKATVFGSQGEFIITGGPKPFFYIESNSAKESDFCRVVITNIEVSGKTAEASLYVEGFYGNCGVEERLSMVKTGGEWKIICRILKVK